MNTKRLALATLASTVTLSATGYAIFGVVLPGFYTDFMNAGSASGVARQPMLLWPIALGMLAYGLLIALAIETRPGSVTLAAGMMTGALVSFLAWFAADFILYGISNVGSVFGILVDPLLEAVPGALAGGVIAAMHAKPDVFRSDARRVA